MPRAVGLPLLVLSGMGFPLSQLAIGKLGRHGALLVEGITTALLIRDTYLVASGAPARLEPVSRALLYAELGVAACASALGLRALSDRGSPRRRGAHRTQVESCGAPSSARSSGFTPGGSPPTCAWAAAWLGADRRPRTRSATPSPSLAGCSTRAATRSAMKRLRRTACHVSNSAGTCQRASRDRCHRPSSSGSAWLLQASRRQASGRRESQTSACRCLEMTWSWYSGDSSQK